MEVWGPSWYGSRRVSLRACCQDEVCDGSVCIVEKVLRALARETLREIHREGLATPASIASIMRGTRNSHWLVRVPLRNARDGRIISIATTNSVDLRVPIETERN